MNNYDKHSFRARRANGTIATKAHQFIALLSVLAVILLNTSALNGQIIHEETKTGGASNSTTVQTSGRLTGVPGHFYLAAISTRPRVKVNAVSGLGLNWALVKEQCAGRNSTVVEVWMAQGTLSGNDTVRATLANVPLHAVIAVSRYSGVHTVKPVGNVISGNTKGKNGQCSGSVDASIYAFDLPTTVDGAVVYGAIAMRARTHTPGAGYTERAEIQQGPLSTMTSVAVEDKSAASASTVAVGGAFSGSVDWAVVALEIKPQPLLFELAVNTVGSGSVALNPPNSPPFTGGTYEAGTVVTLTATPVPGLLFGGWGGDLIESDNPITIKMDGNKNVTATFTAVPPSGEIVHEETQTGGSSHSTTVTTSMSLAGVQGHLYLAAISTRPIGKVNAVSGLGLNWTLVKAQCAARSLTGVEVWIAQGTPSGDGPVTATLAFTPSSAVIAVSRYSGVNGDNPISNVVSVNTKGKGGTCLGGSDASAYSFNLTTTLDGAVVYGAIAMRTKRHTPGAGYTERAEVRQDSLNDMSSLAIEDKLIASASAATVNGSLSGIVDWAVVAVELKPPLKLTVSTVGLGSVALTPPGGAYYAGTVVKLAAIPPGGTSGFQFSGWSGDLSGSINPANIVMDNSKKVTAIFIPSASDNQVTHQETQTGSSSHSTTVTTSTGLVGVSGHLYLAAISTRPAGKVLAISGLGLNWKLVKAQCSTGNVTGVEVWMAQGAPSSNGPVTATLASASTNAVIAVSRYSGVHGTTPVGNVVSGNPKGKTGSCSGSTKTAFYTFDLTTTVNGAVVYGAAAMRNRMHTPGVGYTERTEIQQGLLGTAASVAVEEKRVASASLATIDGSFDGSVGWAVVAVEIKPIAAMAKREAMAEAEKLALPAAFQLEQNYPNPFSPLGQGTFGNPSTTIKFALPEVGKVTVNIYNETGQLVRTLIDGEMPVGWHELRWNGRNQSGNVVAAGVYFYRMTLTGNNGELAFSKTQRMMMVK